MSSPGLYQQLLGSAWRQVHETVRRMHGLEQVTEFRFAPVEVPEILLWRLLLMATGVVLSGLRDLYAAFEFPHGGWPWETGQDSGERD